jgi:hypothetical protein
MSGEPTAEERNARLRRLLEQAEAAPRPYERVLAELDEIVPEHPELPETLRLLAEADRRRFWLRAERHWYARFGWRMMRPLLAVAIVGALVFLLQRAVQPALGLSLFLLGASAFYFVFQLYAHRWSVASERRLAAEEQRWREALRGVIERL